MGKDYIKKYLGCEGICNLSITINPKLILLFVSGPYVIYGIIINEEQAQLSLVLLHGDPGVVIGSSGLIL